MKLKTFSISNYRSIRKTEKIEISNYNVLIGPNNEGKSNILKGLVTALTLATTGDYRIRRSGSGFSRSYHYSGENYNWLRDIPTEKKDNTNTKTVFTLEFEFSPVEKGLFKKETGSTLNTTLSLKLQLGYRVSDSTYDIVMQGKAKKTFSANLDKIAAFIKERIDSQYIPCIRTEDLAYQVIEQLLQRTLENNASYQKAFEKLQLIQEPILKQIQNEALTTIKEFIPEISNISIERNNSFREMSRRPNIQINDGTLTSIEEKGDGIKSLVAISLMKYAASSSVNKNLIILIEEPESHLHPRAIHGLRQVLLDLSNNFQIIVSSHSQLLVDKLNVKNNIIVQKGSAKHSNSIKQIRDSLGVEVADNLVTANFAILLEGQSDVVFIDKILSERSKYYSQSKQKGHIILENLHGCSKASYMASLYKNLLIEVFLLLDSDSAGTQSMNEILNKGILTTAETLKINVTGMRNSELEDLIDISFYKNMILDDYNVNIDNSDFKKLNKPWSDRIKHEFTKCGQVWDENIEKELKEKMANIVVTNGYSCILSARRPFVDNLVQIIDNKIQKIK